jgi:hypothetical protein
LRQIADVSFILLLMFAVLGHTRRQILEEVQQGLRLWGPESPLGGEALNIKLSSQVSTLTPSAASKLAIHRPERSSPELASIVTGWPLHRTIQLYSLPRCLRGSERQLCAKGAMNQGYGWSQGLLATPARRRQRTLSLQCSTMEGSELAHETAGEHNANRQQGSVQMKMRKFCLRA